MIKQYRIMVFLLSICSSLSTFGQQVNVDSLIEITEDKTLHDTIRLENYMDLFNYYYNNDIVKAKKVANTVLKISQSKKIKIYEAMAYNALGVIHIKTDEVLDSAIYYLDLAEKIATPLNDAPLMLDIHNSKGYVYILQKRDDKALECFLIALEIAEKSNRERLPMLLNNIAVIWNKKKDYTKAILYLKKSLKVAKELNDGGIGTRLNNIATNYKSLGQLDSALYYYKAAMIVQKENNDEYSLMSICINIANLYIKKKQHELGVEYAEIALKKAKQLNFPLGLSQAFITLAELENAKGNYKKAILYAEQSLSTKITDINEPAFGILHEAYAKIGNYTKAYDYLLKEKTISDSSFTAESEAKIRELEIIHDVEQKEKENDLLKLEQLANEKTIQSRNFLSIALLLGLLLVGSWGFLIYKSNQRKKEDNQILESKNKELEGINKLKTQFFSNISHEFKTPLTLIISPLKQLLRQKNITTEQRYLVKTAEQNSTQLLELTKQFLELVKLDVKQIHVQKSTVELAQILKMLFSNFEPLTIKNHLDFNLIYNGKTPLFIETDAYKFKIIIKNLLSNAIKYTAENGRVDLIVTEQEADLKIEVKDNGQGIHSYDIPNVFNRFYQVNPDNNRGGTGIGLAICQEYANLLGGSIRVESEWEKGSTFTVIIPKIEVKQVAQTSEKLALKSTVEIPIISTTTTDKIKILIVEDNLDMQDYIRFTLDNYYETIGTPNGKKALEILEKQDFDLIITDLMMPEMDGIAFVNEVKSNPKLSKIPLIMLSAVSDTTKKIEALRIGIDDYMTKPFEAEELLIRVEHLLQFYTERNVIQSEKIVMTITETEEAEVETTTLSEEAKEWLVKLENVCLKYLGGTDFTMTNLAHEMAMSYSKLWRMTNKMLGMTPTQYLQEIRFREALRLLNHQEVNSIKQLAYKVGFKDEKNFSRNFKKRFGKSPSEYLK